jgi:hypothetical protein
MLFLVSDVSNFPFAFSSSRSSSQKKGKSDTMLDVKIIRGRFLIRFMRFTTVQTEECLGRSINGSSNILIRTI